jgi:hypothetical protein
MTTLVRYAGPAFEVLVDSHLAATFRRPAPAFLFADVVDYVLNLPNSFDRRFTRMVTPAQVQQWTAIGLAAVNVAEQTANSESTGASKKQMAMDIITSEAGLASNVVSNPLVQSILSAVVDGLVLANNLQGVFSHKATNTPSSPAAGSTAAAPGAAA